MADEQMRQATVGDVVRVVHRRYDPATAEDWDTVGLICGDPDLPVRSVLLAVDATAQSVDEALERGVQLLLVHHPLLLRPVSSVAAVEPAGRLIHRLIVGGCALLAAHTNADSAADGVSQVLAELLGVDISAPVIPSHSDSRIGLGRIGDLVEPTTLSEFADKVYDELPLTAHGLRIAGDLQRVVSRVAVCGGSGSDLLADAARLGADVVVTADLKHHNAGDFLAAHDVALIDVSHWASEWPWLSRAARLIETDLAADGFQVKAHVSTIVSDPWTARR